MINRKLAPAVGILACAAAAALSAVVALLDEESEATLLVGRSVPVPVKNIHPSSSAKTRPAASVLGHASVDHAKPGAILAAIIATVWRMACREK